MPWQQAMEAAILCCQLLHSLVRTNLCHLVALFRQVPTLAQATPSCWLLAGGRSHIVCIGRLLGLWLLCVGRIDLRRLLRLLVAHTLVIKDPQPRSHFRQQVFKTQLVPPLWDCALSSLSQKRSDRWERRESNTSLMTSLLSKSLPLPSF